MKEISRRIIEQLPKTDLHCHFDGSLRVETLIELAKKNKIALPSFDAHSLMEHMRYGKCRATLTEYLEGFVPLVGVLQHASDIERAFFEVCEDAAAENVWHLELRYCPALHTEKGLTAKEMVECALRAGTLAESKFNMTVRHILCGLKHHPSASVEEMARLAVMFRDSGVVAFDMAGPEVGFPIKDHQAAITLARENHLGITLHAGENSGPENIIEALVDAGAQRIGHGTSLIKDARLLRYVIDHRIGIESCPNSNFHTGSVKSIKHHPLKFFLDHGVRVSINTDNRLVSDTTITNELMTVINELDLSLDHIRRLLTNGFKSAFLPYEMKAKFLKDFEVEWRRICE